MSNTFTYYISGVWKDSQGIITHVNIHLLGAGGFAQGQKANRGHVADLIKSGYIVNTIRWNYTTAGWVVGARVEVVREGTTEYLRTRKDAVVADNLDNMINGVAVFI